MTEKTINKLLSGRFWLTMITGLVFAYATWKKILPEEAVASIIVMVFMSYFNQERKEGGPNGDNK